MIQKWSITVDIYIYYNKLMTKTDIKNKLRLQLLLDKELDQSEKIFEND